MKRQRWKSNEDIIGNRHIYCSDCMGSSDYATAQDSVPRSQNGSLHQINRFCSKHPCSSVCSVILACRRLDGYLTNGWGKRKTEGPLGIFISVTCLYGCFQSTFEMKGAKKGHTIQPISSKERSDIIEGSFR